MCHDHSGIARLVSTRSFMDTIEPMGNLQTILESLDFDSSNSCQLFHFSNISKALELLTEKIISSAGMPLSPGDCMRRVMEALSTGLLINGPALYDPCEKEPHDALVGLTKQQREDLTVSAQTFLRMVAFRQIYKVIRTKHIPFNPPHFMIWNFLFIQIRYWEWICCRHRNSPFANGASVVNVDALALKQLNQKVKCFSE